MDALRMGSVSMEQVMNDPSVSDVAKETISRGL